MTSEAHCQTGPNVFSVMPQIGGWRIRRNDYIVVAMKQDHNIIQTSGNINAELVDFVNRYSGL
jgi:hypothetical protein